MWTSEYITNGRGRVSVPKSYWRPNGQKGKGGECELNTREHFRSGLWCVCSPDFFCFGLLKAL